MARLGRSTWLIVHARVLAAAGREPEAADTLKSGLQEVLPALRESPAELAPLVRMLLGDLESLTPDESGDWITELRALVAIPS